MMKIFVSLCFCLLFFRAGGAVEYQPWFGNFYEFEQRSSLEIQSFHSLSSGSHFIKYPSHDAFLEVSLSNALPDPAIGVELSVTGARTRKQRGDIDQIALKGSMLFCDDVRGDSFSVMGGVTYFQAFRHSLKDVSSFHHGLYNGEVYLSIGQERSIETLWSIRWWALFACGLAEQGSPWLRCNLDFDKRICEHHEMSLFAHSLWGLGEDRLKLEHFQGYGSIKHESINLGLKYTYVWEYFGTASVAYSYRVYALNFPRHTHQILFQLLYTFGL